MTISIRPAMAQLRSRAGIARKKIRDRGRARILFPDGPFTQAFWAGRILEARASCEEMKLENAMRDHVSSQKFVLNGI